MMAYGGFVELVNSHLRRQTSETNVIKITTILGPFTFIVGLIIWHNFSTAKMRKTPSLHRVKGFELISSQL